MHAPGTQASCSPALPAPPRLVLPGGTGAGGYPPSGWQTGCAQEGPPGKGALDELQCQHMCANITDYPPHYKHPAGRQGSNQPKLFKIETEIAAQECQGNRHSRDPAPGLQGLPLPAALKLHLLPLPPLCNPTPTDAPRLARWEERYRPSPGG